MFFCIFKKKQGPLCYIVARTHLMLVIAVLLCLLVMVFGLGAQETESGVDVDALRRELKKPRVEADTVRVVWWNLVSLPAVLRRNPFALYELVLEHDGPDIINILETRLQEDNVKFYSLGYTKCAVWGTRRFGRLAPTKRVATG